MSWLEVSGLTKTFDGTTALSNVSLNVEEGEFFCIVGPTNAGKSTLLKTIAGLHRPDSGRIALLGRDVTDLAPKDRGVSLLFQNIALFPTLTGYENIAFPLRTAGMPEAEVRSRVDEVAEILKVAHILDRHPRTFSGGEQQRVALGRAIARPTALLMLDEPLTNLDARIRIALRIEFKKLHRETGQTVLYVTHDQVEAMSLSDRVAVLNQGRFEQIDTPNAVYHQPAARFVAEFIGMPPMNFLRGKYLGTGDTRAVVIEGHTIPLPKPAKGENAADVPERIDLGIRPEAVRVSPSRSDSTPIGARVFWVEHLGPKSILDLELGEQRLKAVVPLDHPVHAEGDVWIGFEPRVEHILDPGSGRFTT